MFKQNKVSPYLKVISGIFELCLSIPFLGGLFIILNGWAPLVFMFAFHAITLGISMLEKRSYFGSIAGLVTSVLGVIPFVGMMLHFISGIAILISAFDEGTPINKRVKW
jgi:hypothetical protein